VTKPKLWRLTVTRTGEQVGPAVYRWADIAEDARQDVPKWMRKAADDFYSYLHADEVEL